MKTDFPVRVAVWVFAVFLLSTGSQAQAMVSQVGGGVLLNSDPLGVASQVLTQRMGWRADVWFSDLVPLSAFETRVSLDYLPFRARGAEDIQLNYTGVFAGLTTRAPGTEGWSLHPFLAVQLGAVYHSLTYPSGSNINPVTQTVFGTQVTPGLEVPMLFGVNAAVEFPLTSVFTTHVMTIWSWTASLRWRL